MNKTSKSSSKSPTNSTPKSDEISVKPEIGRPVEWTETRALKLMEDMEQWFEANQEAFTLKHYTSTHAVNHQKMSELKYSFFQDRLHKIKDILECRINDIGMVARNPAYMIFMQKNHHGYTDRQDIHSTGTITMQHTVGINSAWNTYIDKNKDKEILPSTSKEAIEDINSDED